MTLHSVDAEEVGMKVDFKIGSVDSQNENVIDVKSAWAIKDLTIPLKHTRVIRSVAQWPDLHHVCFPDVERKKISVLIGTNLQEVFIPLEVRRGIRNEPVAIKSCIGWSILGGSPIVQASGCVQINLISGQDVSLNYKLEEFWKGESYGTTKNVTKPMSVEDQRALKRISDSVCKRDGHYQMDLLWKDDNHLLPYNRVLAETRLQHLQKRFGRDQVLELKYRAVIEDCVAKGYARKLTKDEVGSISDTTWYLPHHPVTNQNKPGKVRVVFDAAARFGGTSLNEQLVRGPTLTNDLTGVLVRFREDEIAFSADIETQDNEETYSPEVIKAVHRNFYVDDVLKSVPTPEQAVHLASDLVKLLKEGGFRLTKFASNSREVLQSIPSELRASPNLDLDLDQLPTERALCVYWDAQSDTFKFKTIAMCKPSTKRGVLSTHGYAAVSYLRFVDEREVTHCSFVMGKTRNAPIREWAIPRLELQAAVLAASMSQTILRELDFQVHETYFCSDSMTSLQYIKNDTRRFQTFVANRVSEIHETTSPEQWHHIHGVMNPADEGSGGVSAEYFQSDCRWWTGPEFLWQPEHT
ncbi:uncharacterized protein [Montipora foliosa]|uniref:uncharacterized protein n=1 Tax=Montipora foliosa TaxID=591990 RepID=UPI0035F199AD